MSSPNEYQMIDPISVQVVQYRTDWSDIGSVRVEADPQAVENDVAVLARKIALRAISAAANSMYKAGERRYPAAEVTLAGPIFTTPQLIFAGTVSVSAYRHPIFARRSTVGARVQVRISFEEFKTWTRRAMPKRDSARSDRTG